MNTQLVDALRTLDLKPGQTRLVQVDGQVLEIRVPPDDEPSAYTGRVMLMPWFESPDPAGGVIQLSRGALPPPDLPIMPEDYDETEGQE